MAARTGRADRVVTPEVEASLWPVNRLGEALAACLPTSGLPSVTPVFPSHSSAAPVSVDDWVECAAPRLALEVVAFQSPYPSIASTLRAMGSALLRVGGAAQEMFLVCVASDRRRLRLLGPDHTVRSVAIESVHAALCDDIEASITEDLKALAEQGGTPEVTEPVRRALLHARLRDASVRLGWIVRAAARTSLRAQMRESGLWAAFARFLTVHLAGHLAWILAWLAVGADALQGRLDSGRFAGAGVLLAAFAACSVAADRSQAMLALRVGLLLRRRLLEGALAVKTQEVRGSGIGSFLGRIYESQALESSSVAGGLAAVSGAIEWVAAVVILVWAHVTWLLPLLLVALAVACWLSGRMYLRERRAWTLARLGITRRLIEDMVGHRTHLVQGQDPERHSEQDRHLALYLGESRSLDRRSWLIGLLPRVWLVLSAGVFGWMFVVGTAKSALAVALAGVVLAFESLRKVVQGLPQLAAAHISLETVGSLLEAAARPLDEGDPSLSVSRVGAESAAPLLDAQRLCIRAASGERYLLRDSALVIRQGDRILLEGPSGGGKSTLAGVLAGLRLPDHGVLLLGGLDRATIGESAWRRRVSLAAQFHENHIVSASLAFNLLMGRPFPSEASDYADAERLCRELGLGELLERMPGGLHQMVGESGWQLSHGEKSRIFLARALLQRADLVILDESLAALDPVNLQIALDCVVRHAPTLLIVAHP
jgi:ATP-binding cassette, subfamily B, bacterial